MGFDGFEVWGFLGFVQRRGKTEKIDFEGEVLSFGLFGRSTQILSSMVVQL